MRGTRCRDVVSQGEWVEGGAPAWSTIQKDLELWICKIQSSVWTVRFGEFGLVHQNCAASSGYSFAPLAVFLS